MRRPFFFSGPECRLDAAAQAAHASGRGWGRQHGEFQREAGAMAGFGSHGEPAAHELGEPARKRQAQARAAVLGAHLGTALAEFLEDDLVQVGGDAGARIDDPEAQGAPLGGVHLQPHAALPGELERIAQQVVDDLLEPQAVAPQHVGYVRGDALFQREPFLRGRDGEEVHGGADEFAHGMVPGHDGHGAGLHFRKVQDLGQQGVEVLRRAADQAGGFAVGRLCQPLFHELRKAVDAGERGAQFVRNGRQEFALGAVGGAGLGFARRECHVLLLELAQPAQEARAQGDQCRGKKPGEHHGEVAHGLPFRQRLIVGRGHEDGQRVAGQAVEGSDAAQPVNVADALVGALHAGGVRERMVGREFDGLVDIARLGAYHPGQHAEVCPHQHDRALGADVHAAIYLVEIARIERGDHHAVQVAVAADDGPAQLHGPAARDPARDGFADEEAGRGHLRPCVGYLGGLQVHPDVLALAQVGVLVTGPCGVEVAAHEPAVGAHDGQLVEDVRRQAGLVGEQGVVLLGELSAAHFRRHAQRGLVGRRQDPQRLLFEHAGQVGILASLGLHGVLPFGLQRDGDERPGGRERQEQGADHQGAQPPPALGRVRRHCRQVLGGPMGVGFGHGGLACHVLVGSGVRQGRVPVPKMPSPPLCPRIRRPRAGRAVAASGRCHVWVTVAWPAARSAGVPRSKWKL